MSNAVKVKKDTRRFLNLKTGKPTTSTDPERGVWYTAGKGCDYWTDDWSKLAVNGLGIPTCPFCGSLGFQVKAGAWDKGAQQKEAETPGYLEVLARKKEACLSQRVLKRFLPKGS